MYLGVGVFKHADFHSGFGHLVICMGSAMKIICIQQKTNTCKPVSRENVLTVAWSLSADSAHSFQKRFISALPTARWHDK